MVLNIHAVDKAFEAFEQAFPKIKDWRLKMSEITGYDGDMHGFDVERHLKESSIPKVIEYKLTKNALIEMMKTCGIKIPNDSKISIRSTGQEIFVKIETSEEYNG